MSREQKETLRLLRENAISSRQSKHGTLWTLRNGKTFQTPKDHGNQDWRAWKNNLRALLRILGVK